MDKETQEVVNDVIAYAVKEKVGAIQVIKYIRDKTGLDVKSSKALWDNSVKEELFKQHPELAPSRLPQKIPGISFQDKPGILSLSMSENPISSVLQYPDNILIQITTIEGYIIASGHVDAKAFVQLVTEEVFLKKINAPTEFLKTD